VRNVPSTPPPLPRSLADPRPVIAVGTFAWFVTALVVFLATDPPNVGWISTTVTGGLLGFVGFGIMHLQRSAARRGSRSAQRGLL
jgi:hypothetical protein